MAPAGFAQEKEIALPVRPANVTLFWEGIIATQTIYNQNARKGSGEGGLEEFFWNSCRSDARAPRFAHLDAAFSARSRATSFVST